MPALPRRRGAPPSPWRGRVAAGRCPILAGCGSASADLTLRLIADAEAAGADALLVPPPHFFHYEADDLAEFYSAIARAASLPVLLYRLPCYLSDVGPELAAELIGADSRNPGHQGQQRTARSARILSARPDLRALRFVGNDGVLAAALRRASATA